MKAHTLFRGILTLCIALIGTTAIVAQTPVKDQSVGLVLSGGGAKGIAHIGVIRALEENDIPIDYIAGTSMGSIVGGLYACGYTPEEMLALITSPEFASWSTGKADPSMVYYFSRSEPTPAIYNFNIGTADSSTRAVPASLINPLPMNFAFMELFAAYTAQCKGNFNNLFVPYRCVASNMDTKSKVVFSRGSVGDCIRASMSFPLVFQPISIDGAMLYDGGIYDNFPVDVMTDDFAPDIMIGVDVAASGKGPQTSLFDQIEKLVMQQQSYAIPAERGIKMRINLDNFGLLDFEAARQIYDIGYNRAMEMMDSIKSRITARTPAVSRNTRRGVFKSRTPFVRFNDVKVEGGTPAQNKYIDYLFRPAHADTFGIAHARESFYRAITPGRLRDLFPQAIPNDSDGLFTLDLTATPKRNLNIGIGGYITSSANSFLFASAGFKTLSFASVSAEANMWIGQSYMAGQATGAINMPTSIPSSIGLVAVTSRRRYFESDRMFFDERQPSFIIAREYFGRLTYTMAAGARAKIELSAGVARLRNSFYRTDIIPSRDVRRNHDSYTLGQARIAFSSSTLNNVIFPTSGASYKIVAMGLTGSYSFVSAENSTADISKNPKWIQLQVTTRNFLDLGRHFSLGFETDILASTRKLMGNYNADITDAPDFSPTPAFENTFNASLRANSYVAAGIVPVYKYNSALTLRFNAHAFVPMRSILVDGNGRGEAASHYGGWFKTARYVGQINASYALPFNATASAYVNYVSAGARPWGVGLTLGMYITAPRFLR